MEQDVIKRPGVKSGSVIIHVPTEVPSKGMRARISFALEALGTRKNAANLLGVSADSLARYIRGENMPPFDVMARLGAAADVSLDWLATGKGSHPQAPLKQSRLNPKHMTRAIQAVESALTAHKATLQAASKAEAISLIYELLESGLAETDVLTAAERVVNLARMPA